MEMLTLECYWYEEDGPVNRHTKKYQHKCVGTLIQQAFLEKMAHLDWVGYRIVDWNGNAIVENFTRDAVLKKRYAGGPR